MEECFKQYRTKVFPLVGVDYVAPPVTKREVKNILVSSDHANWRTGHYAAVANLAVQLNKYGYNALLCLRKMPPKKYQPEGVSIVINPGIGAAGEGFHERIENYKRIVEDYDIDTVILNSWKGSYKYWDLLILHNLCSTAEGRVRVLLHFHSSFARGQFKPGSNWLRLNTAVINRFDGLIMNNEVDAAFWSSYHNHVYWYPLPIGLKPRISLDEVPANHTVINIARFSPTKNQLACIDAFRHVVSEVPDAKLILAGNDSGGYQEKCRKRINELGLSDHIEIRDYVSGEEKDELFRNAYCALNTSLFEGFSQYLCEAKAYGLPVVTYNLPNATMLDGAEKNGAIVIPSGNTEILGKQLTHLLSNPDERQRLAKAARAHFEQVASFDHQKFWKTVFEDIRVDKQPVEPFSLQRRIYDSLYDATFYANRSLRTLKSEYDIVNLSEELKASNKIIRAMKNSRSWRYTRFIRSMLGHDKFE